MIKKIVNSIIFVFITLFLFCVPKSYANNYYVDINSFSEHTGFSGELVYGKMYLDTYDDFRFKVRSVPKANVIQSVQLKVYSGLTESNRANTLTTVKKTNLACSGSSTDTDFTDFIYFAIENVPSNHKYIICDFTITLHGETHNITLVYEIAFEKNDVTGGDPPVVNNPPTLSYTLSPTTQAVSVTIKVTAKDDKGINYIVNPAGTKTYSSTVSYTVTSNGNYKFTAYDTDGASKALTVSVTNIVANKAPSISHTLSTTSYATSVVITVTATDDYGINYIQKPDSSKVYATKTTYTVTANGTYTFIAYDIYGLSKSLSVKITNIASKPTLTLTKSTSSITSGNVTITANASGVAGISYIQLPNSNKVYVSSTTYSVSSDGTYSFIASDTLGQKVTASVTISNIDKTKPSVSISVSPTGEWVNQNIKVTITATDA